MRLVLWDIDGTLVDTAGRGQDAFSEAFEAVVGRPPVDAVAMAGHTDHQIATALLEKAGVEEVESHLPRMLDELATVLARKSEEIREHGHVKPGVPEALEALSAREDVIQSLLTGNVEAGAAVKLAAFGLEEAVDLEVGGYGSDPHRARSDLVRIARARASDKYGVELPSAATVLIGDTPLDVRAAHEAGARSVAVASGSYRAGDLREAGADAVFEDLRDTGAVIAAVTAST